MAAVLRAYSFSAPASMPLDANADSAQLSNGFSCPNPKWRMWYCPICSRRFKKSSPCIKCIQFLKPFPTPSNTLFLYDKFSRRLIHGFKYRGALGAIPWLAEQCLMRIPSQISALTWIPASHIQRRKRGYDQGELLAKVISRFLLSQGRRAPALALLGRKRDIPQTRRSQNERTLGPRLYLKKPLASAFAGLPSKSGRLSHTGAYTGAYIGVKLPVASILLLDDVITTGTSIGKGRQILESAGAGEVYTLGIARTKYAKTAPVNSVQYIKRRDTL